MNTSALDDRALTIATGIMLLVAGTGTIVYATMTPIVSVAGFGWLLLFAGIVEVAHAVQVRSWSGFLLYVVDGLIRAAAGLLLMAFPSSGLDNLTLVLSFYLFVGGVYRTAVAAVLEFPGWVWTAAAGLVSVTLAVMLAVQWPVHSPFLVALAAGFDTMLYGWSLLMYAGATRRVRSWGPAGSAASQLALQPLRRRIRRDFPNESA